MGVGGGRLLTPAVQLAAVFLGRSGVDRWCVCLYKVLHESNDDHSRAESEALKVK